LDSSASSRSAPPDPTREAVANKIAHDVVGADPAIMSLIVLDHRGSTRVIAVARSANLPSDSRASPALVERFGIAATVVWGAAEGAAQLMGRREFIIGAFKDQLVLLVGLREYEMLLAMRLNRSANAEHVYAKVANLLGLS